MSPAVIEPLDAQQVSALVSATTSASPEFAAALRAGQSTAEALARHGLRLCRADRTTEAVKVVRAAGAREPSNHLHWLNRWAALI